MSGLLPCSVGVEPPNCEPNHLKADTEHMLRVIFALNAGTFHIHISAPPVSSSKR